MTRLCPALIAVGFFFAGPHRTVRAGNPAAPPSYFIYPVKTELQKELAPDQASAFVFVDTTNLIKDGNVTLTPLGLPVLAKELLPHRKGDAKLHFTLFFARTAADPRDQRDRHAVLRYALIGFAHDLGFAKVTASEHHHNDNTTWDKRVASFTGQGRQPEGDEPAAKNDLVKIYPVRTGLSRYLTSDADCAVVIVPSLAKHGGAIPKDVLDATTELLAKVKLSERHRLSFFVGRVSRDHIPLLLKNLQRFADTLGFKTSTVTFR
jgi:hypothetical protein